MSVQFITEPRRDKGYYDAKLAELNRHAAQQHCIVDGIKYKSDKCPICLAVYGDVRKQLKEIIASF